MAKILVVDDEAVIRLTVEDMLTREGYQVVSAETGQAALALLTNQIFDLALIDLKLEDMEGMDILAVLRQQSPDTIVIMLTAYASLETAVEALRYGAHDYLFKPCPTLELRESVRRGLLKRRQEQQQHNLLRRLERYLASDLENLRTLVEQSSLTPWINGMKSTVDLLPDSNEEQGRFLKCGGLIVDFLRHVIILEGHLLELSPTEFDLLAYLVSEFPRAISPQELLREVRGYDSEQREASEIVRAHIYHIRQKIQEATGRIDIICTVRGLGYAINE